MAVQPGEISRQNVVFTTNRRPVLRVMECPETVIGQLNAGTLKDLGLVLFFGMGFAVYSSIFFATPVLTELKMREPRLAAHAQRVLAKRAATKKAAETKKDEVGAGAGAGRTATGTKGRPAKAAPAAAGDSDSPAL